MRASCLRTGALCLLLGVLAAAPASAQDKAPPAGKAAAPAPAAKDTPAPAPAPGAAEQAEELIHSGMAHRRAAELDEAIADFQKAYALQAEPDYMYLIGEAHQAAGHSKEALAAYRKYLALRPNAEDKQLVKDQIELLTAPDTPTPVAPAPAKPPAVAPIVPIGSVPLLRDTLPVPPAAPQAPLPARRVTSKPPLYKNVWLWTSIGLVVVGGAAVGLALGLRPTEPAFVTAPGAIQ